MANIQHDQADGGRNWPQSSYQKKGFILLNQSHNICLCTVFFGHPFPFRNLSFRFFLFTLYYFMGFLQQMERFGIESFQFNRHSNLSTSISLQKHQREGFCASRVMTQEMAQKTHMLWLGQKVFQTPQCS